MDVHHNNNDLSSMESKASSSSNEHGGNNSLDDAVGKLLQGMRIQFLHFVMQLKTYNHTYNVLYLLEKK